MTLLQRRHRAVYRVYSEDEYLAGADPFADWNAGPAAEPRRVHTEPKHGHSLQRVAGVVALTGAVGTVGVTVGLGLRSHPRDRQIAVAAVSSPARTTPAIGGGPRLPGSPTHISPRREAPHLIGARLDGERRGPHRTPVSGQPTRIVHRAIAGTHVATGVAPTTANPHASETMPAALERQSERDAHAPVASAPPETSTPAASTAQSTPAETAPPPTETAPAPADTAPPTETAPAARAQSEFGFEH